IPMAIRLVPADGSFIGSFFHLGTSSLAFSVLYIPSPQNAVYAIPASLGLITISVAAFTLSDILGRSIVTGDHSSRIEASIDSHTCSSKYYVRIKVINS